MRIFAIALAPLLLATGSFGALLEVGPSKIYQRPCLAVAAAQDGDTIEIDAAGKYAGDVCGWTKNRLTLRGVNGRPKIDAAGKNLAGQGIWVLNGADTTIENIEFSLSNGAGIALAGRNATVRNCYIHHNDEGGIVTTAPAGWVLIEFSEFAYNGNGNGKTHNVNISSADVLTFRFNYSHHANSGHLIRAAAAVNYIQYNRLSDEDRGNARLEIDFPNAGFAQVVGNIIHQSSGTTDPVMLEYGEEGPRPEVPGRELYVVNNTFIDELLRGGVAVLIFGAVAPVILNNIFVKDPGEPVFRLGPQSMKVSNNMDVTVLGALKAAFVDPDSLDVRLRPGSPPVDAGGDTASANFVPDMHYVHPACGAGRQTVRQIDVGAYEFGGLIPMRTGTVLPDRCQNMVEMISGADRFPGVLSPGSFAVIQGDRFTDAAGPEGTPAGGVPLPTALGGVTVRINNREAPLYSVGPNQINLQIPWETQPGTAIVSVTTKGGVRPSASAHIVPAAPRIFVSADDRGIIQNADFKLNGKQTPAAPGSIVACYLTGQGSVSYDVPSGAAVPIFVLSRATMPTTVKIGGQTATVLYFGLTPGLVGVAQANVRVPDLAPGDYPFVITVNGVDSNAALIAVGGR